MLTQNELKLLSRGPKYMVRDELSLEDFKVELEKMVANQKLDNAFNSDQGEDDLSEQPDRCNTPALQKQTNEPKTTNKFGLKSEVSEKCKAEKDFNIKWEENICNLPYDCREKVLDMGNLRATQYKHNKMICLPQPEKPERESGHEARRNEMLRVYNRVANAKQKLPADGMKSKSNMPNKLNNNHADNRVDSNLSDEELEGLRSLKKRIKDGSLIICDSDKSKRFIALTRDQYVASGLKHTKNDVEIQPHQVKHIQSVVNDHVWWLTKMSNCGSNWKHEDRMHKNTLDKGEQVCPMVLLIKDHKGWSPDMNTPPPSRPVVSGNCGLNSHLSDLISLIMEPVTSEANGFEVDSTSEMLHRINLLNDRIDGQTHEQTHVASSSDESVEVNVECESKCEFVAKETLPTKRPKFDIRSYGIEGSKTSMGSAKQA